MIGPVVVFGSAGMLGSDLVASAPPSVDLRVSVDTETGSRIDIADARAITRVLNEAEPHVVINAAAYTRVDLAEEERNRAHAVNAIAPGYLASECARRGIALVHFSTDYVFRGTSQRPYKETDPVDPVNEYGRSKLAGEEAILASGARALIIRTQWLFGSRGTSVPRTMWDRATRGLPTSVVDDQFGSPTYTCDLAETTWRLIERGATGLVHVANMGWASWFDVADEVFTFVGVRPLLTACHTAEYPTKARRPAFSVLDTSRLQALLGLALPPWRQSLRRLLAEFERESGGLALMRSGAR